LSGLPVTNWKKRTGAEMRGTPAQCVERFLNLPHQQQRDCSLRIDGYRTLEAANIVAFVATHGLPPSIAARVDNATDWLRHNRPQGLSGKSATTRRNQSRNTRVEQSREGHSPLMALATA
jgi:hypothetical protein